MVLAYITQTRVKQIRKIKKSVLIITFVQISITIRFKPISKLNYFPYIKKSKYIKPLI